MYAASIYQPPPLSAVAQALHVATMPESMVCRAAFAVVASGNSPAGGGGARALT